MMKLNLKEKLLDEKFVWFLIVAYTIILSVLTSLKHYCFRSYAWDLGIWIQIFWHTLRGNFMYAMPRWGPLIHPENYLGVHVSPLIILLLPIYYVFSSPYTLLILQSFVLSLPALYLYRIAKIKENKRTASIIALLYLIYLGTLWPNWYDFHLQTFVPLFISMAYYYHQVSDDKKMFLSLLLLLSVAEYAIPIVLFFIGYILVKKSIRESLNSLLNENRKRLLTLLILTIVSITYFAICQLIKNSVFPRGLSLSSTMQLFEPITYTQLIYKIAYILMLFGPLLFIPFLSLVELIPALPFLCFSMITARDVYFQITWQYPALVSIPIFIAAIHSLPKIRTKYKRRTCEKLILASVCFLVFLSPISPIMASFNPDRGIQLPNERIFMIHTALSSIEPNATVLTQANIFPHLAERQVAFTVWPPANVMEPPDYIVVDLDLTNKFWHHYPYENPIDKQLYNITENYTYRIIHSISGFLVLKHNYLGAPKTFSPLNIILRIKPDQNFLVQANLVESYFYIPMSSKGIAWTGPLVHLPPGKYVIKVSIKTDQQVQDPILKLEAIWWKHATYAEKLVYGDELNEGNWTIIEMEFQSDKIIPDLEVVGRSYGVTDIWVRQIEIIQVG